MSSAMTIGLTVSLLLALAGESVPRATVESTKVTFQHGVKGYQGTVETELWEVAPSTRMDTNDRVTVDGNNSGGISQVLMRFDGVIGPEAGQIPRGARIEQATLTLTAFDPGSTVSLHQMLIPWDASSTWDRLVGGVARDGFEAANARDDFTFGNLINARQSFDFNVKNSVQAWADGRKNYGWVFDNAGGNGWDFFTSESDDVAYRPLLQVTFEPPPIFLKTEVAAPNPQD